MKGKISLMWMNMVMASGWGTCMPIQLEWWMGRTSLGTLLLGWPRTSLTIISEWVTDNLQSGSEQPFITSQPAMHRPIMPTSFRMSDSQVEMISKVFGPTFISHTASQIKEQLPLSNTVMVMFREHNRMLLIQEQTTWDLSSEEPMMVVTQDLMVYSRELSTLINGEHSSIELSNWTII